MLANVTKCRRTAMNKRDDSESSGDGDDGARRVGSEHVRWRGRCGRHVVRGTMGPDRLLKKFL